MNWPVLRITKPRLSYIIWFKIFEKDISQSVPFFHHGGVRMHQKSQVFSILSTLTNYLCGLVVFIDMNMYIFTEGRKFKILLKETYSVVLDSCYLFNKKMLNIKFNMILIVLMKLVYIRHF